MIHRGALRRQEAGSRRQETPEGVAACLSNLVETHVT